jgi:hypothetical protein
MTDRNKTLLGGLLIIASGGLFIALVSGEFNALLGTWLTYFGWAFGVTLALTIVVGLLLLFSGLLLKVLWAVIYAAGNAWHAGRLAAEEGNRSAVQSAN